MSANMCRSSLFRFAVVYFVLTLLHSLHSNAFIYSEERGSVEAVLFTDSLAQFNEPHNLLYFKDESMAIHCQLRNRSSDTPNSRNALVKQYSEQGMSPTVTFITLDWSKSYKIETLVEDGESVYWSMNISKHELLEHSGHGESQGASNGKIPWRYKIELEHNLNLFESWGTVVVPDIEPLLLVQLGDHIAENIDISAPNDVIFWQHPCTPGIAVLVPMLRSEQSFTGCYIAITYGRFTPNTTHWYDLLHRSAQQPDSYSICKESSFASCEGLSILDFSVVDNYILLVTTKGLIRSESIFEAAKGVDKLKFHQVSNIHPILDQAFKDGTTKHGRIKLHHTAQCYGHELSITKHAAYLVYTYTSAGNEDSILLTTEPPFEKWSSLDIPDSLMGLLVLGVAWDIPRNRVVLLMKESYEDSSLVAVLDPQASQLLQPVFRFPQYANLTRITFHAHTHVIFVYGSEVWLSLDGGNSFHTVLDSYLRDDSVSSLFANTLGDAFVLVTKLGAVYSGWSGITRVSEIEPASANSSCPFKIVSFHHQKSVNIICIQNTSNALDFITYSIDLGSRIKADRILLFRPLLVTFVSEMEVELSAFCVDAFFSDQISCSASFHPSEIGRVLRTRNGGSVMITEVEQSADTSDFSTRVTGLILTAIPFVENSESPALQYTLQVNITGSYAYLQLQNSLNDSGWRGEDIGKTLQLSNGINLILSACSSISSATGRLPASWNNTITYFGIFEEGTWFLIDFRPFHSLRPVGSPILHVRRTDINSGLAEILNGADKFAFSSEMVGDVVKHGHGWGTIASVISSISVSVTNSNNVMPGNFTDNWGVYKAQVNSDAAYIAYIPTPQLQGWWFAENECRHFLVEDLSSRRELYYLDSNEKLSLTLRAISKGTAAENPTEPLLRLYIGNTFLFDVNSYYRFFAKNHTLHVTLTKKPFITGISSVSVRLHQTASLLCKKTSYILHGGCPPYKRLRFLYPLLFSWNDFLNGEVADSKGIVRNFKLPFNYRAPSPRGKAIPMSENTYNVDPQKPLYKTAYAVTRNTQRYKQCKGKRYRSECGCTAEMRGSSLVKHSDCIDTAYRMLFSETLTPRFVVLQEVRKAQPLSFPFYVEELNQRKDFIILSPSELTYSDLSSPVLMQDLNSSIQFEGSGLYHFRARVVQKNYTFCALNDEFMVFVVDTPLPFPVNDVVRACTGMGFISLLFIVYMRHFHGKKKMKND